MLERIDVIMCTYNSNKPYFRAVLKRISHEIPVHCFVLLDRFSSDGTVSEVLKVFRNAKVILSDSNLGRARKMGIDIVDTAFFAFIDDDVLLSKGWYEYTKGLMCEKVGAVACYAHDRTPLLRVKGAHYARPQLAVSSKDNVDSQRGFTYATLLKKDACVAWKPDKMLAAGEDHEILRHVVKAGFLWLTSYFPLAEHLHSDQGHLVFFREYWNKAAWNTAGCRYIGLGETLNPVQLILRSSLGLWRGIKEAFAHRNAFIFTCYCLESLAFVYGYVCWKKKLFLTR